MKLDDISRYTNGEHTTSFEATLRDGDESWVVFLEVDSTLKYYWDELERRIRHKLAEKLGLEEPLHKAIGPSEGIQKMEWSSPNATEDYVDRDLGLEGNRDDG